MQLMQCSQRSQKRSSNRVGEVEVLFLRSVTRKQIIRKIVGHLISSNTLIGKINSRLVITVIFSDFFENNVNKC